MSNAKIILEHLNSDYTEPVRDPVWNHIYLSRALKRLMATSQFQKLSRIKQLGPAYLVYPGATHTRLNHSLGVFALAKRIVGTIVRFSEAEALSIEGAKSFLCAALLHDLGHYPYAHSLKELPLRPHENLTAEIIMSSEITSVIKDHLRVDPAVVAAIVDLKMDVSDDFEISLFRTILSGPFDPDKLDYLTRDAYFCGLSYGTQDVDFIISKMRYSRTAGLSLGVQGVSSIENLLFSKYLMYRSVYWHKTVRIATAMIKKAIYLAIKRQVIKADELYGLDDERFFRKFSPDIFPSFSLISRVEKRNFFKMVWEEQFMKDHSPHSRLTDLDQRTEVEARIADRLSRVSGTATSAESVIIDIPEPISFEVDMHIETKSEHIRFMDSGTVFDAAVVAGFSHALRKIRVFVAPEIVSSVRNPSDLLSDAI